MEKERKIKWWQYNPEMTEKQGRLGNRIIGLGGIVFGTIMYTAPNGNYPIIDNLLDIGGVIFMIKGAADLISGDHGYVCSKVVKFLSKGKVKINYQYNRYTK